MIPPVLFGLVLAGCRSEPDVLARAWVRVRDPADLAILRQADVSFAEAREGDRVAVIGSDATLGHLQSRGLDVDVTAPDHRLPEVDRSAHPDPDDLLLALRDLANHVPSRVEYVELGQSVAGRDLAAVRLGSGSWAVRVVGAHHGDEPVSGTLALAVAEALTWGVAPDAEVWVLPHVNPDGVAAGTRYNDSGVDLNRNYDYAWSDAEFRSGDRPFSEPEVRAIRSLAAWRPPASGLTLHAGARNITWPWNHTTADSPDENLMFDLASDYSARCTLEGFEVMNGAEWYITHGDLNDWSYGRRAIPDLTVEVSQQGAPDAAATARIVEAHLDAILDFLARPPQVVGRILDAEDGQPIEATITPVGGTASFSGPDGLFARFLPDGGHVLAVSAPGWSPALRTVVVSQGLTRTVEVRLERAALLDVSPILLPWSEDPVRLAWDGVDGEEITLYRPGEASIRVALDGDAFPIVASALSPGPWGLRTSAGAAPRVVFVGEVDDRVEIEEVERDGSNLLLTGHGFGLGSRAWALAGPGRPYVPLEILAESDHTLVIDGSAALDLPDPVDLLLVSDGAHLAVLDVWGNPHVDTGEPRETGSDSDTGAPDGLGPGAGGCGCGGSGGGSLAGLLLAAGAVIARRRGAPAAMALLLAGCSTGTSPAGGPCDPEAVRTALAGAGLAPLLEPCGPEVQSVHGWSPDGARLLVHAAGSLYLVDVVAGRVDRLWTGPIERHAVAWIDADRVGLVLPATTGEAILAVLDPEKGTFWRVPLDDGGPASIVGRTGGRWEVIDSTARPVVGDPHERWRPMDWDGDGFARRPGAQHQAVVRVLALDGRPVRPEVAIVDLTAVLRAVGEGRVPEGFERVP